MKREVFVIGLLIAGTFWCSQLSAAEKPIVAVFDIETKMVTLKPEVISALTDFLATRMAAGGSYQVIPRNQVKDRLTDQKKASFKECYDQACQIEIGKELAANLVLSCEVMKIGEKCVVTAELFDLGRAATDKGDSVEGDCTPEKIMESIKAVAEKLGGPAASAPAAPAASAPAPAPAPAPGASTDGGTQASVTAELRWPPLCSASRPGECLAQAQESNRQGKKELAFLEAVYALDCANSAGQWNVIPGSNLLLRNLDRGTGVQKGVVEPLLSAPCQQGDLDACFALAKCQLANKQGVSAAALFRNACDAKHLPSCNSLGTIYRDGLGLTKDFKKAVEFFKSSCDRGNLVGCNKLGYAYAKGEGVSKNQAAAVPFFRRACDGGLAKGCGNLGTALLRGAGIEKNLPRATALLQKACQQIDEHACFILGKAFRDGKGVPKDDIKAAELLKKACSLGSKPACKVSPAPGK